MKSDIEIRYADVNGSYDKYPHNPSNMPLSGSVGQITLNIKLK
jgi:hypothetical protein